MADTLHNYILELHYTTTPSGFSLMNHVMRMYVYVDAEPFPGEEFDSIGLLTRNILDQTLLDLTDDFMVSVKPFYPAVTEFGRWELWKQPISSSIRTWISTKEIGENGTHVGTSTPAGQLTFSFRTTDGKYTKLMMMESAHSANNRVIAPYSGIYLDFSNMVKSLTQSYANKYHGRPVANLAYIGGENEELFEKRFR